MSSLSDYNDLVNSFVRQRCQPKITEAEKQEVLDQEAVLEQEALEDERTGQAMQDEQAMQNEMERDAMEQEHLQEGSND